MPNAAGASGLGAAAQVWSPAGRSHPPYWQARGISTPAVSNSVPAGAVPDAIGAKACQAGCETRRVRQRTVELRSGEAPYACGSTTTQPSGRERRARVTS